jgi:tetratricopeptide (TPR) repeat protein
MVHVYAGNLLMTTGSYDDATKAFTNADCVTKCSLAIYQRARCQIALSNIEEAFKDLGMVSELTPEDEFAAMDEECLKAIKLGMKDRIGKGEMDLAISMLTKLI